VALSSTNRPKETYRGERLKERSDPVDSFAVNEAALLLSMVAANLMHADQESSKPNARGELPRLTLPQPPGSVGLERESLEMEPSL
jgi:hypothetical protein